MKKLLFVAFTSFVFLPYFMAAQVVEEIITRVNNQIVTRSEFQRIKDQLKDECSQQDASHPDKLHNERKKNYLL